MNKKHKIASIAIIISGTCCALTSKSLGNSNESDLCLEDIAAYAQAPPVWSPGFPNNGPDTPPPPPPEEKYYYMAETTFAEGDEFTATQTFEIEGSVQTACEAIAKAKVPGCSIGGSSKIMIGGRIGYRVTVTYRTKSESHMWECLECRKEQTNCPDGKKGEPISRHVWRGEEQGCSHYPYYSEIGSFWIDK